MPAAAAEAGLPTRQGKAWAAPAEVGLRQLCTLSTALPLRYRRDEINLTRVLVPLGNILSWVSGIRRPMLHWQGSRRAAQSLEAWCRGAAKLAEQPCSWAWQGTLHIPRKLDAWSYRVSLPGADLCALGRRPSLPMKQNQQEIPTQPNFLFGILPMAIFFCSIPFECYF